jgi:dipeptidyl aminopeptidase/acylaminoacyl peptidase
MTYYNMYEQMEWGLLPHQGNMMDVLWERSALKHVAKVATPTMLVHGENDNDVPIAESEQFFIALKDVGVPVVMVRYPREGHGLREPAPPRGPHGPERQVVREVVRYSSGRRITMTVTSSSHGRPSP